MKKQRKFKDKAAMFQAGRRMVKHFCAVHGIRVPRIKVITPDDRRYKIPSTGWYTNNNIAIKVKACAHIGVSGSAWSYPGWIVDRTPYGVMAHELGHHIDWLYSDRRNTVSKAVLADSEFEDGITSYAKVDTYEWFAESFRLFLTNPELLSVIRPKTFAAMEERWQVTNPLSWDGIMWHAPIRTWNQAVKRIDQGY